MVLEKAFPAVSAGIKNVWRTGVLTRVKSLKNQRKRSKIESLK